MANKKLQKTHVPDDILVKILSRLPVKSLIRFICVSNRWRFLLYDPQFAKYHFKVASEQQTLNPSLLISTASELRSVHLETPSFAIGGNSLVRNLSFPFKKQGRAVKVLGSCNGLVCVALDFHECFYIWNPCTRFLQKLPDPDFGSEEIRRHYKYGFGYASTIDDYKVVVGAELTYETDRANRYPVVVFSLRANSWKKIQAPFSHHGHSEGALSNEALHWLHTSSRPQPAAIAFDLAKEEFRNVMLPICEENELGYRRVGVLLEGCLCAWANGFPDFEYLEIWVMREYNVYESWTVLFRVANDVPMFIRESGTVVMRDRNSKNVELIWLDKNEDKLKKDVVLRERYMLQGFDSGNDLTQYVESLLPFVSIICDQQTPVVAIPLSHLITVQEITVQNISIMVPMKLTGPNFTIWKWLFLQVLRKYRVEGLVEGTEICPPAFLFDTNGKMTNQVNPAFEKWMDRDQSVKVWLNSRISEDLLPYTVGASSSHALWTIMKKRFADADCPFG
ncbi:unnamed protein product [Prunus armeniaca]|uniref:F-box domain-containing protein n=1 Tax=Prunus armeniaca TaxID=36596 RepID=A0A6J5VDT7_PRUAR|nr:unnamed protein product [Prunus armeniaca]